MIKELKDVAQETSKIIPNNYNFPTIIVPVKWIRGMG